MLSLLLALNLFAQNPLETVAEQSKWLRTGRYDEVVRLCKDFAAAYPETVKCESFGTSGEGRPMLMLEASAAPGRPVIVVQAGIHAGEIDGKDAGFWVLRDVLAGKVAPGILKQVTLIFVPVLNVDGHERFGANNRPNQNGPAEMGWRTTAANLNLNRDYTKAEAVETSAMLRLLRDRDPIAYVDLHVTDGAEFQHDVAVLVEPAETGPAPMLAAGKKMRDAVIKKTQALGHLPLPFYPSFVKDDDPASGFAVGLSQPRFAVGYYAALNRYGVLVETHSWKNYAARVLATRSVLISFLEVAGREVGGWVKAAQAADEVAKRSGGTEIVLEYENTERSRVIDFKGYAYARTLSPISGGFRVSYDVSKPQIWRVPFYDQLKVTRAVVVPKGGYVIPPAHAGWLGAKLREHGVEVTAISSARAGANVEVFRVAEAAFAPKSFEGRTSVSLKGAWVAEKRELAAGSLWVPIAQRRARLLAVLLEPASRDSYASWGFFNAYLEQKEYMEGYVAEQVAAEMLAKDPALRAEFEKRIDADAAFRQSPEARLDFFYRRHPSYDRQLNVLPVVRMNTAP